MEISPISVAENCHIWKADGKIIAIVAITKKEKQL
jgi:hypothetical protein